MDAIKQIFPDIDSFCDVVITREFSTKVKPHPDHLLTALDALDTDAEFAAMVGDHPMDITVGKDVGGIHHRGIDRTLRSRHPPRCRRGYDY